MLRTIITGFVTLLCAAHAWSDYRVDSQSIEIGDWRFIPIVEDDGVNPAEVHSFVALLDDGVIAGSKIGAIWYAKNPNTATVWESVAWEAPDGHDHWAVFGFVQGYLNIPEGDWENWETDQPKPAVIESAGVPVGYYRGMFESNPLNEIVGDDPMRDQLIDALVENAYEAAQVEVDRESAERGGVILDALGQGVLAGKQGQDPFAAFDGAVGGLFPLCFESTWYTTPSAWSAPPANAGWILYEQEDAHGACFACRYSRIYTISRTRTATHRHNDCSYTVCNQMQTKTIEDRGFVACTWASCPQVFSGTPTITETKTWLNKWTPPCP